ncbi:MAG TPA: ATP-binding protein [Pseudomonadales bacterium]|nr:ATP-binding protein [Pseudomonadales bacterium]
MNWLADDIVAEIEQRRFQLNINLLKVYNYYRVFVGVALLAMFLQHYTETRLGRLRPETFLWVALFYTGINLLSAMSTQALPARLFRRQLAAVVFVLYDISTLAWLMYLSGGVGSGLGVVILVAVAAGSVLVTGRVSAFIAAVASIVVLYEEFYVSLMPPDYRSDYFQAGILGAIYFATSFAIQTLSARLRRTEITSLSRAAEVADLERVNRSIVQRMRTGIIVVDNNDRPRMLNQSARSLLGLAAHDQTAPALPDPLLERLRAWRADTGVRTGPFEIAPTTPEIRANFSAVRPERPDADVIVFLEDTVEIQQRAQQLKLAALGRLSASIAHEIRNPLGAISHAGQLLSESRNLDKGDTRLTDIINMQSRRMNGVIENVLELSRRKPPSPIRLNLKNWLTEFVTEFRQSMPDAVDIRINVQPATTEVRVDPGQLGQALTNLAVNGLRYSKEKTGRATLAIDGGIDQSTDRPYLNVVDDGPGVPDDRVDNLFEPFFTTERTGTGLGLYITREMCEANQARVTYSRDQRGGSCFRITFAHPDRITA